jgi:pimeloyl-ACP methyl ester carboxylesterase
VTTNREIHHRFATVDGRQIFYREGGPAGAPTIVFLHGYPSSSLMFRHLLPELAVKWHVIAPDYLGFGLSDAPSVNEFAYTFDALADSVRKLLTSLGVSRYALVVHDYGAPIGWRLALASPESITAIVSQNGNAYEEGLQPAFFDTVRAYWSAQTPESEADVRQALTLETTRWQYLTGVPDQSLVDPTMWIRDHDLLSRPGSDLAQLSLFLDYSTNPALYPRIQEYFRSSQVPLLAVWGKADPIFASIGAELFQRDLPGAEVHLLEGGHFLLESALDHVLPFVREFLDEHIGDEES